MSWNANGNVGSTSDDWDKLQLSQTFGDVSPELMEQFNLAKELAKKLVESKVVGGEGHVFAVYLSGHSNPNHEPASGYANDCVTVTVSQIKL